MAGLSQDFDERNDPLKIAINEKYAKARDDLVRQQRQLYEARVQEELQRLIKAEKPELALKPESTRRGPPRDPKDLTKKAKEKVAALQARELAGLEQRQQDELRTGAVVREQPNRQKDNQQEKRAQLADRQGRQRHKLEADIEKQYGANRRQLQKQQQDIQQRRGQTGWRGLLYQVSGRSTRDREAEKGIAKTLTNIQQRETEAREALTISQAAEESSLDRPAEQARTAEQQIESSQTWGQDAGLSATFDGAAEGRDEGRSLSAEHSPHRHR